MAISTNPSKTRGIENSFRRENRKRFKSYNIAVKDAVNTSQRLNNFKQTKKQRITNINPFEMSETQFESFMRFLRAKAYQDIIGVNTAANANSSVDLEQTDKWQEKYINAAYMRGIQSAEQQIGRGLLRGTVTVDDLRDLFAVASDARLAQVLISTNKLHGETVIGLQNASLNSLVQAIETMLGQISRDIDAARVDPDVGTTKLSKKLSSRISVANSAGEQIASTNTIQAAQKAQINNATIYSEQAGEEVKLRWITRNDDRVRHLHAGWHGDLMTQEEAAINITKSPYNCRCAFQQVPVSKDSKRRQERFDKERQELLGQSA